MTGSIRSPRRSHHGQIFQIHQVYLELDSGGHITTAGGRGAAALTVRAALAPHLLAAQALLSLGDPPARALPSGGPPALYLRAAADLAPHAEVLVWFAEEALAALDMPFLTPRNIRARRQYQCHLCSAAFHEPNPLKVHLFLTCAPYDPPAFWREVATRLHRAAPLTAQLAAPLVALRPAELEALATEWGRSQAGHQCLYCGKLYSRRYGLKIHIRTHTGYRPLRCRYCLRAFGDPSNLNKHVRLHRAAQAGGAPHTCATCGRTLARRRDLERHLRTHPPAPSPLD